MTFKAKLSKQGNSYCIYVPKRVRTELSTDIEYEWSVRTKEGKEENKPTPVRTLPLERKSFNTAWCSKHDAMKGTCGCK